jgi:hypothetical protein
MLVLLAAAVLLAGAGCGGDQEKGIYSNKDRPTAGPRQAGEPAKPLAETRRATEH